MSIKSFSQEYFQDGNADSDFIGSESGIILETVNVDIHDEPGVVKLSKGLTLEVAAAGTTPPDVFCACAVNCSDTNTYWFSYTNGKIWSRTKAGVWALVHTIADCSYFNGAAELTLASGVSYIFFSWKKTTTGKDFLGYKVLPGVANWSDAVDSHKTETDSFYTATWHPMTQQGIYLAIGNKTKIATVDDVLTFTASGTPDVTMNYLPNGWEITSMINYDDDILLGASQLTGVATFDYSGAMLLKWDFSASTWTQIKPLSSEGIQAMVTTDNGTFIFTGNKGLVYTYDGTNLVPIKRIRKTQGLIDTANGGYNIYPNAVANFQGYALFGVSSFISQYAETYGEGIWTLGRRDTKYPLALTMQYAEPCFVVDGTNTINQSKISWGAILSVGKYFIASYSDTTATTGATGVAVMQPSKRAGLGWIAFGVAGDKDRSKTFLDFAVTYRRNFTLGSGLSALRILDYFLNYDYTGAGALKNFSTNFEITAQNKLRVQQKIEGMAIQPRIYFYGDTTVDYTPSMTSFYCEWNQRDTL
jgi:hypothetical protein